MKTLNDIYTDSESVGFLAGSAKRLLAAAKLYGIKTDLNKVKKFLATKDSYTRTTRALTKFPRRQFISFGPRDLLLVDLADFQSLVRFNSGYRYVLVAYLYFSKVLLLAGLKSKKAIHVAEIFRSLIEKYCWPNLPRRIQTDKG
jgi:hypothetical protein